MRTSHCKRWDDMIQRLAAKSVPTARTPPPPPKPLQTQLPSTRKALRNYSAKRNSCNDYPSSRNSPRHVSHMFHCGQHSSYEALRFYSVFAALVLQDPKCGCVCSEPIPRHPKFCTVSSAHTLEIQIYAVFPVHWFCTALRALML